MIDVWVRLIESGSKEFDECPAKIKESVRERLIEDGYMEE